MVRDNLDKAVEQSQKQNHAAETQNPSRAPEEPAEPQREPEEPEKPEKGKSESETQLELLRWENFSLEDDPDSWCQRVSGADAQILPTHIRPFTSAAEYRLVKLTFLQLQQSGYYWGPMTMEEAHEVLASASVGTFLIRDSCQSDVLFTLSYQSDDGPTSVRVQLSNLLFSLHGSHRTFPSVFALLAYYTCSSCKLTVPYRRQRPERLKQMCRRALTRAYGPENIHTLPGLSTELKDFVYAYPCCI